MSSKRYLLACAHIEDSDQPVHSHSLIRVVDGRLMGSQESNPSSGGKLRIWPDCAVAQTGSNLRWTHMQTCTLYWLPAPILFHQSIYRGAHSCHIIIHCLMYSSKIGGNIAPNLPTIQKGATLDNSLTKSGGPRQPANRLPGSLQAAWILRFSSFFRRDVAPLL